MLDIYLSNLFLAVATKYPIVRTTNILMRDPPYVLASYAYKNLWHVKPYAMFKPKMTSMDELVLEFLLLKEIYVWMSFETFIQNDFFHFPILFFVLKK